jgi:hypothetical protein
MEEIKQILKNNVVKKAIKREKRKAEKQFITKLKKADGYVIKDDETKTPVRGLAWSAKVAPTPDAAPNEIRGFGRVDNIEVITPNLCLVHTASEEDDMSPNNHCSKSNHKDCTLVFIS